MSAAFNLQLLEVFFFRKSDEIFPDLQISKKIFQKTILSLFKFQAQDSFVELFLFLRFGDLKNESPLTGKQSDTSTVL